MKHRFSKAYGLPLPRRYSKQARKDYLAFAKSKNHTAKRIRKALRKQLGYVARDIRYVEGFMHDGYAAIEKLSFEAYNESTVLKDAVERFKKRTGQYPKRVLVD